LRHLLVTSMLSCMIARVAVLPSPVGATAALLTLDPLGDYCRFSPSLRGTEIGASNGQAEPSCRTFLRRTCCSTVSPDRPAATDVPLTLFDVGQTARACWC
jgi:hypothetical protein